MKESTGDAFAWRLVDLVAVKGKQQGKRIYEPLGPRGEVAAERLAFAQAYEAAWQTYQQRQFAEALSQLAKLLEAWPHEPSLVRLYEICQAYAAEPPPADWDGVARMQAK